MTEYLGKTDRFEWYGEWVFFETEEEKKDAEEYFRLWMKFIIKKVKSIKYVRHQIIQRDYDTEESLSGSIKLPNMRHTLGIKLEMEKIDG